jgi:hypothetical protein
MKTYALFSNTSKEPLQTYEGEEMVQNKEYVSIYKGVPRQNSPIPKQVLVAAILRGLFRVRNRDQSLGSRVFRKSPNQADPRPPSCKDLLRMDTYRGPSKRRLDLQAMTPTTSGNRAAEK